MVAATASEGFSDAAPWVGKGETASCVESSRASGFGGLQTFLDSRELNLEPRKRKGLACVEVTKTKTTNGEKEKGGRV